jgi:hypothetical protein
VIQPAMMPLIGHTGICTYVSPPTTAMASPPSICALVPGSNSRGICTFGFLSPVALERCIRATSIRRRRIPWPGCPCLCGGLCTAAGAAVARSPPGLVDTSVAQEAKRLQREEAVSPLLAS